MKKIILFTLIAGLCLSAHAEDHDLGPRSIVKTNLGGDALLVINLNYEYKISDVFSAGLVAGYAVPKERTLSAFATDNSGDDLAYEGTITPTGFFVNPYGRVYTSGAMTGFYLELWTRFYRYTFEIPYDYRKNGKDITAYANGKASAFGGGLNIGTQIGLGPLFVLDFFAGFGMGVGSARAETNDPNLDEQDYADIKAEMESIDPNSVEINFVGKIIKNLTYDATSTEAWAETSGYPIPIPRAGISFGIVF